MNKLLIILLMTYTMTSSRAQLQMVAPQQPAPVVMANLPPPPQQFYEFQYNQPQQPAMVANNNPQQLPAPYYEPVVYQQQPVAQQPIVQEPVAQQPVVQQPPAQQPVVQEPVAQQSVAESDEQQSNEPSQQTTAPQTIPPQVQQPYEPPYQAQVQPYPPYNGPLQQPAQLYEPQAQQPIYQQQTIYDEAVAYWSANNCQYPPKNFYPMFQYTCNVVLDSRDFTPGLCYAFFNSTKQICNMELQEDENETLLSVTSLQETFGNDELCDTLSSLKQDNQDVFPTPSGANSWFKSTYDILFSQSCKYACGIGGSHPICFGYLLSYDVITARSGKLDDVTTPSPPLQIDQPILNEQSSLETSENSVEESILPASFQNEVKQDDSDANEKSKSSELNTTSKIFRPNPKLLLGQKLSLPEYYDEYDDTFSLSDDNTLTGMDYSEEVLQELDQVLDVLGGKDVIDDNLDEKGAYMKQNRVDLMERLNKVDENVGDKFDNQDTGLPDLDLPLYEENLDYLGDLSDEELAALEAENWMSFSPVMNITTGTLMVNFLFLSIGIIVLIALFMLFRASRRGYIRRLRLGGGGGRPGMPRHWNYERVQTQQPDDNNEY